MADELKTKVWAHRGASGYVPEKHAGSIFESSRDESGWNRA